MNGDCELGTQVTVSPTSATANHAAASPGNQAQFVGRGSYVVLTPGKSCGIPAIVWSPYGTWSNPDPTAIQISSANDSTNGTAVCSAATNGPVTLTGTFTQGLTTPVTKSVQLTCE